MVRSSMSAGDSNPRAGDPKSQIPPAQAPPEPWATDTETGTLNLAMPEVLLAAEAALAATMPTARASTGVTKRRTWRMGLALPVVNAIWCGVRGSQPQRPRVGLSASNRARFALLTLCSPQALVGPAPVP